jgi:DNA replication and repair protein RecF
MRQKKGRDSLLDILTESMITLASEIVRRRLSFVSRLNKWSSAIHSEISDGREQLSLVYESSVHDVSIDSEQSKIEEAYKNSYRRLKQRELDRGSTLFGPHRDDLQFFVNGRNVQTFGSQGQQRTAALSVKLAEIELIKEEVGEYPLLLLDDVLSELDDVRKTHLLSVFRQKVQTFVTTTSIDGLDQGLLDRATLFSISQGKVEPMHE